jgi:hypothetical protein
VHCTVHKNVMCSTKEACSEQKSDEKLPIKLKQLALNCSHKYCPFSHALFLYRVDSFALVPVHRVDFAMNFIFTTSHVIPLLHMHVPIFFYLFFFPNCDDVRPRSQIAAMKILRAACHSHQFNTHFFSSTHCTK